MIKVVIFDFDGVLVDSVDIKTRAFASLFGDKPPEVVKAVIEHHLNNGSMSRFEKIRYYYREFLRQPLADEELACLCDRFAGYVVEEVVRASYVKGAKDFLDKCSKRYVCYVASGTPEDELKSIISRRHMSGYFRGVYGAPKKKADIIREVLNITRCPPQEVVFVGDDLFDYEAVKSNGVKFIGVVRDDKNSLASLDIAKVPDLSRLSRVLLMEGS